MSDSRSTLSATGSRQTPSEIGARAELAVATALTLAGKEVYLPMFAAHSRIDLVFQDESGLYRVQCKTSRLMRRAIFFPTSSNTNHTPRDYRGEIDLFGVYSPQLEQVYLVPVDDVPSRGGTLRIDPPLNCQEKGVRWARDYLLGSFDGSFHLASPRPEGIGVTSLFDAQEGSGTLIDGDTVERSSRSG